MFRSTLFQVLALCAITLPFSSPAAAQSKVGTVNFQKAVLDTADIKKAQADLQAKYKSRQDALDKVQVELNDIQVQLQKSDQLSPAKVSELQASGTKKQRDAQRISDDLQADVEKDRTDILQRVGTRMTEIVKKLAEEKGLDLVVDTTNAIFWKPALEVTVEATAAYDKAYPVK
jgi:outer membrane protein